MGENINTQPKKTTEDYEDLLYNCGRLITFVKFFDENNDINGHTIQVEELLLKIKDSIKKVYDILHLLEDDFRKKKKWNIVQMGDMRCTNEIIINQYKLFIKRLKNGEPILDIKLKFKGKTIRKPHYHYKVKEQKVKQDENEQKHNAQLLDRPD